MSAPRSRVSKRRPDYDLIASLVPDGSRVLDLGCGDGQLLAQLDQEKGCVGRGIEINDEAVVAAIERGVAVYHGDMLEGMGFYHDQAFDIVILSQTLQQAHEPVRVIKQMLRVGQTAIISFPNFGHWDVRRQLLLGGRMPKTPMLPYAWHSTPNVHLCTIKDFRGLCDDLGLKRVREVFLAPSGRHVAPFSANLRAGLAVFQLRAGKPQASAGSQVRSQLQG